MSFYGMNNPNLRWSHEKFPIINEQTKGQCHRLDQKTNKRISKISALVQTKKLYFTITLTILLSVLVLLNYLVWNKIKIY